MLRLGLRLVRAGAAGIGFGFLIITGFAFWAATSASAGGLKDDDVIIIDAPLRVWQGCYIGASAGVSLDNTSISSAPVATVVTGTANDGLALGGYAGCNLQAGSLVLGIEGDINTSSGGPDWFGSARLRLGFAIGSQTLLYATGGVSFADIEFAATNGIGSGQAGGSVTGRVFGGGIEQTIGRGTSVRLEALYYDYDEETLLLAGGGIASVDQSHTVIRVGVTFALGGSGSGSAFSGGGTDPDVVQ